MSDFSFSDLGRVHWGSTLKLVLARGFASGLILALIPISSGALSQALIFPFALAVLGMPLALFYFAVGRILGMFIPLLGVFIQFIGGLLTCIGDPIVYLVNRQWPALLNIADLKFFNFQPIIFITHPD